MLEFKLIVDSYANGTFNMAKDIYLLDILEKFNYNGILRFYKWNVPTLSLGYHQNLNEINLKECKNKNIEIVYRPTGGKAVLHKDELTYSFVGLNKNFGNTLFESYKTINCILAIGLNKLGIPAEVYQNDGDYTKSKACFNVKTKADLCIHSKKFSGSAQFRREHTFLQHGSISIKRDIDLIANILNLDNTEYLNLKNSTISINEINPNITWEEIKDSIIQGFIEYFKCTFDNMEMSNEDILNINKLESKFLV